MKKLICLGITCALLGFGSPLVHAQATTTASQSPTLTKEQEKSVKAMLKQNLKGFEAAQLSSEQKMKAEELLTKAIKEVVVKRDAVKITTEMLKKQSETAKEMRSGGAKGKRVLDDSLGKAGFNAEQSSAFKETQQTLMKAKKEIGKLLKDEQIKKLPEQLQKAITSNK